MKNNAIMVELGIPCRITDRRKYDMKDLLRQYYSSLGIDKRVSDYCLSIEEKLKDRFAQIDAVCEINQLKVLKAMQDNRLSEAHFAGSSGYGYTDDAPYVVFVNLIC